MIVCTATNFVKKEKVDEFKKLAEKLVEATHKEEGCIEYQVYRDREDDTIFTFVEKWKTYADLEAHFETEHFKTLVPKLAEYKYQEDRVNVYDRFI